MSTSYLFHPQRLPQILTDKKILPRLTREDDLLYADCYLHTENNGLWWRYWTQGHQWKGVEYKDVPGEFKAQLLLIK
jgi:hypothetical protein